MPAQEESYESESHGPDFTQAALNTYIDRVGAVSVISEDGEPIREGLFQNRDGHRFEDGRYAAFTKVITTSGLPALLVANNGAMRLRYALRCGQKSICWSLGDLRSACFWIKLI